MEGRATAKLTNDAVIVTGSSDVPRYPRGGDPRRRLHLDQLRRRRRVSIGLDDLLHVRRRRAVEPIDWAESAMGGRERGAGGWWAA